MKRAFQYLALSLIAISLAGVAVAQQKDKEENATFKRYTIEKLLVKFKVSGSQEGIEELAFDSFGMRERKRTVVETMGQTTRSLVIINGDDMYTIDEKAKVGNRIATPMVRELAAQGQNDMTQLAAEMMKQMGGRVVGQEKVLGKNADVWDVPQMGAKIWIWNGVALKTIANLGGVMMRVEAFEIDDNPALKDTDFMPASDVKITDQGTMEQMMQQEQQN